MTTPFYILLECAFVLAQLNVRPESTTKVVADDKLAMPKKAIVVAVEDDQMNEMSVGMDEEIMDGNRCVAIAAWLAVAVNGEQSLFEVTKFGILWSPEISDDAERGDWLISAEEVANERTWRVDARRHCFGPATDNRLEHEAIDEKNRVSMDVTNIRE